MELSEYNEGGAELLPGLLGIELKSNHLSTATEGVVSCVAECVHRGRTTQVWTSEVRSELTGRTIAKVTCTQMILYPR